MKCDPVLLENGNILVSAPAYSDEFMGDGAYEVMPGEPEYRALLASATTENKALGSATRAQEPSNGSKRPKGPLVIVRKVGTSASGFRGHRGRPGKVGGSVHEGYSRPDRTPEEEAAHQEYLRKRRIRRASRQAIKVGDYVRMSTGDIVKVIGIGSGELTRGLINVEWSNEITQWIDKDKTKLEKIPEKENAAIKREEDSNHWLIKHNLPRYAVEEANSVFRQATGQGGFDAKYTTAEFIDKAYNFSDSDTGIRSEVSSIAVPPASHSIEVTGLLRDGDNHYCGTFTRRIYSNGSVEHHYFTVSKSRGGHGFGTAFFRNSEEIYRDAGIDNITTNADIDIGKYAWARMGFDFASETTRTSRISMFYGKWSELGYKREADPPKVYYPWEMAAAKGPNGESFGKQFMLDGDDWDGVKYLKDTSETYRAGKVYYQVVDERKKAKK